LIQQVNGNGTKFQAYFQKDFTDCCTLIAQSFIRYTS
jgi:hypothetical protein